MGEMRAKATREADEATGTDDLQAQIAAIEVGAVGRYFSQEAGELVFCGLA
jgi:hypothetical protein